MVGDYWRWQVLAHSLAQIALDLGAQIVQWQPVEEHRERVFQDPAGL